MLAKTDRPVKRVARWMVVAMVVATGAAGCGDDGDGDGGPDAGAHPAPPLREGGIPEACLVLSEAEVEHVLGVAGEPTQREDISDEAPVPYSHCRWTGELGTYVEVGVVAGEERFEARTKMGEEGEIVGYEPFDGLDHPAFQTGTDDAELDTERRIEMLIEDRTVEVVINLREGAPIDDVVELARRVAERVER